jgi:ABC-type glutathione transport system ATPase component
MPLLEIRELRKYYFPRKGYFTLSSEPVRALDRVNLLVHANETLAIVGESGSGKSTLARCILCLERPTSGSIRCLNEDVLALRQAALLRFRHRVQLIFPDAEVALNPILPVGEAVAEPLIAHRLLSKPKARRRAQELLEQVGLGSQHYTRLPRELSSGQRHRVVIARALSLQPQLLIMDEPLAALDVLTRARLVDLLLALKQQYQLTVILISHDLKLVRSFGDRVAVMRMGRVVEVNSVAGLFQRPAHPYTEKLLQAALKPL